MTYARKLTLAKILVSAGLGLFVLTSFATNIGNLIALPIMLWAVWGQKLHGTGRSVRLMAFLGLAFALGFYLAAPSDPAGLIFSSDKKIMVTRAVFVFLLAGILLSIRRSSEAK